MAASTSVFVIRQNTELACITRSQAPRSSGDRACERNGFSFKQFGLDCGDHVTRDLILQFKHIGQFAVIAVGPDVIARRGVDQLGGDPHAVAALADTAFQHVAHAKFARGALYIHSLALVGE